MNRAKEEFKKEFTRRLSQLLRNPPNGFNVLSSKAYEDFGEHPHDFTIWECGYAAEALNKFTTPGQTVLDVGSYLPFVLGLSAFYDVTSLDVRCRPQFGREKCVVCDARSLDLPSDSFDVVVSLCTVEHFGLGRYGDPFDPEGDVKGFAEMARVLKPGGVMIWTTAVGPKSVIIYNANRVYTYQMLMQRFNWGATIEDEKFFSLEKNKYCPLDECIVTTTCGFDVYCAVWRK